MKNIIKHLGIIALAAVIGLSLTSCDTGSGGGGDGGGPARFGPERTVTGQQVRHYNEEGRLVNFAGDLEIYLVDDWDNWVAVEGGVTGGRLSFTIGTPDDQWPIEYLLDEFEWMGWSNVQSNNPSVYFSMLWGFETIPYGWLGRERVTQTSEEMVAYIWVSHNVIITGTGGTVTLVCHCYDCDCAYWDGACWCGGGTGTLRNINLALEAGWNTIHQRLAGSPANFTATLTVANPGNVGWIWWDDYFWWYDYSIQAFGESARACCDRRGLRRPGRARR